MQAALKQVLVLFLNAWMHFPFVFCSLNEYGASNPSSRAVCGAGGGGASRSTAGTHRQCSTQAPLHSNRNPGDCEALKSRTSSSNVSNTSMQAASTQSASSKAGSPASETNPVQYQNTNRKHRTARQQHQAQQPHKQLQQPAPSLPEQQQQLQQPAAPERQESSPKPPPAQPESSTVKHSFEDSDYSSLLEAMDKDLERPESPPSPVFQEQPSSPAAQSKGTVTSPGLLLMLHKSAILRLHWHCFNRFSIPLVDYSVLPLVNSCIL